MRGLDHPASHRRGAEYELRGPAGSRRRSRGTLYWGERRSKSEHGALVQHCLCCRATSMCCRKGGQSRTTTPPPALASSKHHQATSHHAPAGSRQAVAGCSSFTFLNHSVRCQQRAVVMLGAKACICVYLHAKQAIPVEFEFNFHGRGLPHSRGRWGPVFPHSRP